MSKAILTILGAIIGGLVVWALGGRGRGANTAPTHLEADRRKQIQTDLEADLEDHRQQAEDQVAEAAAVLEEQKHEKLLDWINRRFGRGPGSDPGDR